MCFDGRCLFCSTQFGTVLCVVIDSVISVAGGIFSIELFITEIQKCKPDTYLSIFVMCLFIGCLINILFNISLVDGILCEAQRQLFTYFVFSGFKFLGGVTAMIIALPRFQYYEDILAPSICFFVLQTASMICVYALYEKLVQKEMISMRHLLEPVRVVVPITEKLKLDV